VLHGLSHLTNCAVIVSCCVSQAGMCGIAMQPSYPTKTNPNPPTPPPGPHPGPKPPAPPKPEPVQCDPYSECPPETTCCCLR